MRDAAHEKAVQRGLKDKYVFTLDKPSLLPFMTYSSRRDLRRKLYEGYPTRANHDDKNDNKQLVNDFVRLRTEKAHLLGYRLLCRIRHRRPDGRHAPVRRSTCWRAYGRRGARPRAKE